MKESHYGYKWGVDADKDIRLTLVTDEEDYLLFISKDDLVSMIDSINNSVCKDCLAVQEAEQNPNTECDVCGWNQ